MNEQRNNQIEITDTEILAAFNKARAEKINVVRPKFTSKRETIRLLITLLLLMFYYFLINRSSQMFSTMVHGTLIFVGGILFVFLAAKDILLILIFIYQRFAPASVRSACLYQPCCSEYMRQSIIKYGVCKGTLKGIRRIRRCRPPNCGIDEP